MGDVLEGLVDTLIAAGALPLGHRPDTGGARGGLGVERGEGRGELGAGVTVQQG